MTPTSRPSSARGPAPVRRSAAAPDISPARARLLEHLQQHPGEVTVDEVAREFGQHPNTVREHLDALVEGDLLTRERIPGPGRGRPAWRYRASLLLHEPDPRVREYGALAGALAAHIAAHSPDPRAEARMAGERWGRALIDGGAGTDPAEEAGPGPAESRPGLTVSPRGRAAARRRVIELLAELDFGPRANRAGTRVLLTTCPLLDVAKRHPEVVCAAHEGMVAGALDSLGAPSEGVSLTPFGAPDGCILVLQAAGGRT